MSLFQDAVITFQCIGEGIGENQFLYGEPPTHNVALSPHTDSPYVGSWWRVHNAGSAFAFECLTQLAGDRWLHGRKESRNVRLVPHAEAPYTGARWKVHEGDEGLVLFECRDRGSGDGLWLQGTSDGNVRLANSHHEGACLWRVIPAMSHFRFDSDISADDRDRILKGHRTALVQLMECNSLPRSQKLTLLSTYRRPIRHRTTNRPVFGSAVIGGNEVSLNITRLFPHGDAEIAQTIIHEMMHCAGFRHPERQATDTPGDGGAYYSSPPLQAEICIAGVQSFALQEKTECVPEADGQYTIMEISAKSGEKAEPSAAADGGGTTVFRGS